MNPTLTQKFATPLPARQRMARAAGPSFRRSDDALDPMRGIVFGTLLSVLGFWLPLALAFG